jgi:hypothetical protein
MIMRAGLFKRSEAAGSSGNALFASFRASKRNSALL